MHGIGRHSFVCVDYTDNGGREADSVQSAQSAA